MNKPISLKEWARENRLDVDVMASVQGLQVKSDADRLRAVKDVPCLREWPRSDGVKV